MLWNPKHDRREDAVDLLDHETLIAYLRTRKKTERYKYDDLRGECLCSQYMMDNGYPEDHWLMISPHRTLWVRLNHMFCDIASERPWTFGAALKRAEAEYKLMTKASKATLRRANKKRARFGLPELLVA